MRYYTTADLRVIATNTNKMAAAILDRSERAIAKARRHYGLPGVRRKGTRRWFAEDIELIREMKAAGVTHREIAKVHGVSTSQINQMIYRANRYGLAAYPKKGE